MEVSKEKLHSKEIEALINGIDSDQFPISYEDFLYNTNLEQIVQKTTTVKLNQVQLIELGKIYFYNYYKKPLKRNEWPLNTLRIRKGCTHTMRKKIEEVIMVNIVPSSSPDKEPLVHNRVKTKPKKIDKDKRRNQLTTAKDYNDQPSTSSRAQNKNRKHQHLEAKETKSISKNKSALSKNSKNGGRNDDENNIKFNRAGFRPRKRLIVISDSESDAEVIGKIKTPKRVRSVSNDFDVVTSFNPTSDIIDTSNNNENNVENKNPYIEKIVTLLGSRTRNFNPNQTLLPVSFKVFKNYSYHDEVIEAILKDVAKGDDAEYQEIRKNYEIRNIVLEKFYCAFYMNPIVRNTYNLRFKTCPKSFKEHLLQIYTEDIARTPSSLCPLVTPDLDPSSNNCVQEDNCKNSSNEPQDGVNNLIKSTVLNNAKTDLTQGMLFTKEQAISTEFLLNYIKAHCINANPQRHKEILEKIEAKLKEISSVETLPVPKKTVQIQSIEILNNFPIEMITTKTTAHVATEKLHSKEMEKKSDSELFREVKNAFEKFDRQKKNTLRYYLRTIDPIKQKILYACINLTINEFKQYIHWYNIPNIFNDENILNYCYQKILVNKGVWPPCLYVKLSDLISILASKDLKLCGVSLALVSPALLHWSDLLVNTNYDECVRYDYYRRKRSHIDNDELLQERRQYYYINCWTNNNWVSKTPIINNEVLLNHLTAVTDTIGWQKASVEPIQSLEGEVTSQKTVIVQQKEESIAVPIKEPCITNSPTQKDTTICSSIKESLSGMRDNHSVFEVAVPGNSLSFTQVSHTEHQELKEHNYSCTRRSAQKNSQSLTQNLPEIPSTSTQRVVDNANSNLIINPSPNLFTSPNIFSSDASNKSSSLPLNAVSESNLELNVTATKITSTLGNGPLPNSPPASTMIVIPTKNVGHLLDSPRDVASKRQPYGKNMLKKRKKERKHVINLSDESNSDAMIEDHFVCLPNTQNQIASLPAEVNTFVDPLEEEIEKILNEPAEKCLEVIARIKREPVSTIDNLQFVLNDDDNEFTCMPIEDQPLVVVDNELNLSQQLMMDLGSLDEQPTQDILSQFALNNSGTMNSQNIEEAQSILDSSSQINVIKEILSVDNDITSPIGSTSVIGQQQQQQSSNVTETLPISVIAAKRDHNTESRRKRFFEREFVPQKTHTFRRLELVQIIRNLKNTRPSGSQHHSHENSETNSTSCTTYSQALSTDLSLFNSTALNKIVEQRSSQSSSSDKLTATPVAVIQPLNVENLTSISKEAPDAPSTSENPTHSENSKNKSKEQVNKELKASHIREYTLPTINVGQSYMFAIIDYGRRVELYGDILASLFSNRKRNILKNIYSLLLELDEYHYNSCEWRNNLLSDVHIDSNSRSSILSNFFYSFSGSTYCRIIFQNNARDQAYCKRITLPYDDETIYRRPYEPVSSLINPNILRRMAEIRKQTKKQN